MCPNKGIINERVCDECRFSYVGAEDGVGVDVRSVVLIKPEG